MHCLKECGLLTLPLAVRRSGQFPVIYFFHELEFSFSSGSVQFTRFSLVLANLGGDFAGSVSRPLFHVVMQLKMRVLRG